MLEWAGLLPKVCKVGEGGGGRQGWMVRRSKGHGLGLEQFVI